MESINELRSGRDEAIPLLLAPASPPVVVTAARAAPPYRATRLFSLVALAALGLGAAAVARGAYYAARDAWVAPLQLSPDSRDVVALRIQASKEKEQRARLESELTSAAAEKVAIDLGLTRLRTLADGYAKAVRWSSSDQGGQLAALLEQKALLERQRALTLETIERDEAAVTRAQRELEAGVVTNGELQAAQSNLARTQLTKAEKELEVARVTAALDEATRQADAMAGAAGRPPSAGGRGAHLASPDVIRMDEVRINVELQIARLDADRRAAESRERAARAGIQAMDELQVELTATPLFLAARREIDLAFVPYAHLDAIRAGDAVYHCRWFLFGCREVGRIRRIFPGEVVTDDPWGSVARGRYVELQMNAHAAMGERTLRVRRRSATAAQPAS
ncbi:MAG TPA: hypothetical protein VHM31_24965 [Polyangia bacterium]|nr:hypothetical protein [Polyangia bacterium]